MKGNTPDISFTLSFDQTKKEAAKERKKKGSMDDYGCRWMIIILSIILVISSNGKTMSNPQFTAMYAFGDSLTDPGNNNYLSSLAKANYLPYGVDFAQGPSGRFCNGRTSIDYLGNLQVFQYIYFFFFFGL